MAGYVSSNAAEQVGYLREEGTTAEFFLTQIVSHHDLAPVEEFAEEMGRSGLAIPGLFGVFYYRSANPRPLRALRSFLRVPAEQITRDFEQGVSADEQCARTIRALRGLGANRVYISNLNPEDADERLTAIRTLVS